MTLIGSNNKNKIKEYFKTLITVHILSTLLFLTLRSNLFFLMDLNELTKTHLF